VYLSLHYIYYPETSEYPYENNHVRQLGSLWSVIVLKNFLRDNSFDELIEDTLDYYLEYKICQENYCFLLIDENAKLAYNAFLILSLVNYPRYEKSEELLKSFANGILFLQNEDGSYNTYFMSDRNTGVDYYPGEAMLALMQLYEKTRNKKYVESVKRAFPYYMEYWRNNKNTAFVPWHTQTYLLLYKETKDSEIADFVFEMNDWLINNHQIINSSNSEEIGGFPKDNPKCSTSSYMESVNDAYALAKIVRDKEHIEKYRESIKIGTRFILKTQYTPENSGNLTNPDLAIGGFKQSLTNGYIRNDFVQHAIASLMKSYNNRVF